MSFESYNEKHPWGKPGPNSTIVGISAENGAMALKARLVRQAVQRGENVSVQDRLFLSEREDMIKRATES